MKKDNNKQYTTQKDTKLITNEWIRILKHAKFTPRRSKCIRYSGTIRGILTEQLRWTG